VTAKGKTLKDLAASLGVSVATVSRALAGSSRIAESTKARVAEAARESGYVPNRAARALVSGRNDFAGLVLPIRGHGFEDAFLGEVVSGLGTGLAAHGIDLFLAAVPDGQSELTVIRHIVEARRADGLVLARTAEHDERVAYLVERGFPFVSHGRVAEPAPSHRWLDTDGAAAFAEAFDLLYDLGHRRFGLVTIDEPMNFRRLRTEGLAAAIAARGDPDVRLDTVSAPRFDRATRAAAIHGMLSADPRPTAVIGLFDGQALAVLEEAARLGIEVPRQLSVIGFDDVPAAAITPPGLTTFDADIHGSALEIAGMLVRAIADPHGPAETRLVRARLMLRGSHGPAP
jgi:LacI family transcriptional regulator